MATLIKREDLPPPRTTRRNYPWEEWHKMLEEADEGSLLDITEHWYSFRKDAPMVGNYPRLAQQRGLGMFVRNKRLYLELREDKPGAAE